MAMPEGLFGLWVDFGHLNPRSGRWLREPAADFTCRHGCTHTAGGALDVARFCRDVDAYHAQHCPGREDS